MARLTLAPTAALPQITTMPGALISVVETNAYLAKAKRLMTEQERAAIVDLLAADPECGDLIPDGGGIRKVRVGVGNRGKRGGARVIYFFHSRRMPVFLLTVFAKNEPADLSRREILDLAKAVKLIAKAHGG
jgi:hypothetical protein